jgi:hypothetical protein
VNQGDEPRGLRWRSHLLAAALYLAGALLVLRSGLGADRVVGQGVDLCGTLWYVEWIRHCVTHGVDPGFTDWFFHPTGKDIFAHTGSNFVDALLAQPLRALFGFPGYYLPFLVSLLVGNALAMHRLLRGQGIAMAPTVAVSLLFGLHPYVLHELAQGRPTQALLFWLPLALHHLLAFAARGRWRDAVLAGLFLALQGWTYWFMGHFSLLMLGPVAIMLLWRSPDRGRTLRGLLLTAGVAVLLVLPAVFLMAQHAAEGVVPGLGASALDVAGAQDFDPRVSFRARWLGLFGGAAYPVPARLAVLLALGLILARRRWLWLPGVLVGVLLMSGPRFVLGDAQLFNPLYAASEALLPFFGRLWFPYRGWGVLAVLLCLPLAEALSRVRWGLPAALGAPLTVALVLLFSGLPEGLADPAEATPVPQPAYLEAVRQRPGLVLDLPFLCAEEVIHYQPLHGSPLVGGMAEGTPAFRPPDLRERVFGDPLLAAVATASLTGRLPEGDRSPGPQQTVRWVVLHKHLYDRIVEVRACWEGPQLDSPQRLQRVQQALEQLLGPPDVEDGIVAAWELQGAAAGSTP